MYEPGEMKPSCYSLHAIQYTDNYFQEISLPKIISIG